MKYLVSAVGDGPDARVARRFEKAAWYLIVDDTGEILDAYRNVSPQDHNRVLVRGQEENVAAVVAARFGAGSEQFLASLNLGIAHAKSGTVRDTIEDVRTGVIKIIEPKTVKHQVEEAMLLRQKKRGLSVHGRGQGAPVADGATPRGHHRIQQYSGRGH
jgi:predicted Fe-Mo cluster-binding NifX family protein